MTTATRSDSPFAELGLRHSLLRGIEEAGFEQPTDIQVLLIPLILEGRDVLGQARTGTGKTASFGLPMLHHADKGTPYQALILVPTRELAMQVAAEINMLGKHTPVRAFPIYGGQRLPVQIDALRRKPPQIVVGTPGRVMDLHQRGVLPYEAMKIVVLDEVDRMLDIGFRDDIRRILSGMPGKPQYIFVSATIVEEIERLARRYMHEPEKIVTTEGALTVQQVEQSYVTVHPWDKKRLLLYLLEHEEPDLTLVFCRTKFTVDLLSDFLKAQGIEVHALHGDMPQHKRTAIVKQLKRGTLSVVVCSDLAARGLDASEISHVINFDLPEDPEMYVHRIGRTARAGRKGIAWSFVTPEQGKMLTAIEKFANIEIREATYPAFKPGPVPKSAAQRLEGAPEVAAPRSRWQHGNPTPTTPGAAPTAADPDKFPGGIAPSGPPRRRLGGRLPTRRGR